MKWKFTIYILVLILVISIVNSTNWVHQSTYTFTGGTQNWTKRSGNNGVFTNSFKCVASGCEYCVNQTLPHDKAINITFHWLAKSYIQLGLADSTQSSLAYTGGRYHEQSDYIFFYSEGHNYTNQEFFTINDSQMYTASFIANNNDDIQYSSYVSEGYINPIFRDNTTNWEAIESKDDFLCFYLAGTNEEIDNVSIYYNETGGSPPTPTLTINHNLANTDNVNYDLNFTYNGTISDTTDIFNCTLWVDDILNQTDSNVNLSVLQNFDYLVTDQVGNFSINISCENADVSDNTGSYYYAIDPVDPVITETSGFVNNSILVLSNDLTLTFNITDDNLFAYNISIFNSAGTELENYFAENLTLTSYINISTRSLGTLGNFSIRVEAWDSHTKRIISDYPYEKITYIVNNITYKGLQFNNKFEIVTDDYDIIEGFGLVKKRDRYIMGFNFTDLEQVTFYIKGYTPIIYLPYSKYRGHFIINRKHWLDFESDDVTDLSIVYLEQKGTYRLRFTPLKSKVIFRSIGDLNYISTGYRYSVQSQDTIYLSSINDNISNIYGVIQMIPLVALYIFFMYFGYTLMRTGNFLAGFFLYLNSIGFDFYFIGYYWETIRDSTTSYIGISGFFTWLFLYGLWVWVMLKLGSILILRYPKSSRKV